MMGRPAIATVFARVCFSLLCVFRFPLLCRAGLPQAGESCCCSCESEGSAGGQRAAGSGGRHCTGSDGLACCDGVGGLRETQRPELQERQRRPKNKTAEKQRDEGKSQPPHLPLTLQLASPLSSSPSPSNDSLPIRGDRQVVSPSCARARWGCAAAWSCRSVGPRGCSPSPPPQATPPSARSVGQRQGATQTSQPIGHHGQVPSSPSPRHPVGKIRTRSTSAKPGTRTAESARPAIEPACLCFSCIVPSFLSSHVPVACKFVRFASVALSCLRLRRRFLLARCAASQAAAALQQQQDRGRAEQSAHNKHAQAENQHT
jgi:hypothetical protein